jgi:hypothetical protein
MLLRVIFSLMMLVGITLVLTQSAAAQTGATTLSGESFTSFGPSQDVTLQTNCNADGSGTINFTAEGIALGPYAGTFQESGSIRLGAPFSGPTGPVRNTLEFTADFQIDSPFARVEGRKFVTGMPVSASICGGFPGNEIVLIDVQVRYEAIIRPATGGSFFDEGASRVSASATALPAAVATLSPATFLEVFASDLTESRRLLPTDVAECKDGGYQVFAVFQNQGDCVSFVATNSKNEPGQNIPTAP